LPGGAGDDCALGGCVAGAGHGLAARLGFVELVEEGNLGGVDHGARIFEREPIAAVDFGEGELFAGVAGPFDLEGVADDGCGVEVTGAGPGVDVFPTLLADGAQGLEGSFDGVAGLFAEFADGGILGGFFACELPFWDGPDTGVFVFPEGAAGMNQEDF
jgi:hypothetical protein